MKRALLTLFAIGLSVATLPARSVQPSPDEERRAAITVLRAINTAEIAAKGTGGKYLPMSELLNHPAMGRVKANFAVEGNTYTHAGAGVRLALSADATQYVVTVVSAAPTYTAAFSDERGVIYTGKALE
jgi:hypothetical protein